MSDHRSVTEKRRAANRAAAGRSTGPKSPEGKQRAAFNSFQHGAFASEPHIRQSALNSGENSPAELEALRQSLLADWQAEGAQQQLLVDDLAWLYWLRDQSRRTLLDALARQGPRDALERERRRFNARQRVPALNHGYFGGRAALVTLRASEGKFAWTDTFLDDLEDCVRNARWSGEQSGPSGYIPEVAPQCFYGQPPATERGRKALQLWYECGRDNAPADDPRAREILALLVEERAALVEEKELFLRQQALDRADDEQPGFDPLDETWQELGLGMERLDRQINAKIRLLLRLEKRAAEGGPPHLASEI